MYIFWVKEHLCLWTYEWLVQQQNYLLASTCQGKGHQEKFMNVDTHTGTTALIYPASKHERRKVVTIKQWIITITPRKQASDDMKPNCNFTGKWMGAKLKALWKWPGMFQMSDILATHSIMNCIRRWIYFILYQPMYNLWRLWLDILKNTDMLSLNHSVKKQPHFLKT